MWTTRALLKMSSLCKEMKCAKDKKEVGQLPAWDLGLPCASVSGPEGLDEWTGVLLQDGFPPLAGLLNEYPQVTGVHYEPDHDKHWRQGVCLRPDLHSCVSGEVTERSRLLSLSQFWPHCPIEDTQQLCPAAQRDCEAPKISSCAGRVGRAGGVGGGRAGELVTNRYQDLITSSLNQ